MVKNSLHVLNNNSAICQKECGGACCERIYKPMRGAMRTLSVGDFDEDIEHARISIERTMNGLARIDGYILGPKNGIFMVLSCTAFDHERRVCTDYENRPEVCREYTCTKIDAESENNPEGTRLYNERVATEGVKTYHEMIAWLDAQEKPRSFSAGSVLGGLWQLVRRKPR